MRDGTSARRVRTGNQQVTAQHPKSPKKPPMAAGLGVTRHPFHKFLRLFPECFSSWTSRVPVSESFRFLPLFFRLAAREQLSPVVEHKGMCCRWAGFLGEAVEQLQFAVRTESPECAQMRTPEQRPLSLISRWVFRGGPERSRLRGAHPEGSALTARTVARLCGQGKGALTLVPFLAARFAEEGAPFRRAHPERRGDQVRRRARDRAGGDACVFKDSAAGAGLRR